MNEMVERVANALMIVETDDKLSDYYKYARAAIEAMREPTQGMIIAGDEANPTEWNYGTDPTFISDVSNDIYRAMINNALK